MKKTVYVVNGSEFRTDVTKRVKNTVKRGQVHSETIRTSKVVEYGVDVEIDAKQGITETHERQRVRDALRVKAAHALACLGLAVDCPQFNDIRRRGDGSYIFNEPKDTATVDPRIRDFADGIAIVDARRALAVGDIVKVNVESRAEIKRDTAVHFAYRGKIVAITDEGYKVQGPKHAEFFTANELIREAA